MTPPLRDRARDLLAQGGEEEAERLLREAVAAQPQDSEVRALYADLLLKMGRASEAAAQYDICLPALSDSADLLTNHALALYRDGQVGRAREAFERALAVDPTFAAAHYNYSDLLLRHGDMQRGLDEYEWRDRAIRAFDRGIRKKRWKGAPLAGASLLVCAEQGFGDTILFARYLPDVAQRGGNVTFECPAGLARLMRANLPPAIDVVVRGQGKKPPPIPFDLYTLLGSLPRLQGTTLDSVPAAPRYLKAIPADVARWVDLLRGDSGLRVGLVWAGNPQFPGDRGRSMHVEDLAPLADLPGITFYSLQKGAAADQVGAAPRGMQIVDLAGRLFDFAETAAIMENLDVVVTTCTASAHLAGALGRPTWVLLHDDPYWLWMTEREDSPWYPTVRLFRQCMPGDWTGVLQRVAAALRARCAGRPAAAPAPTRLEDELAAAVAAELFIPTGADILDLAGSFSRLERHLPAGCRRRPWPGERLAARELTVDALPPAGSSTVVSAVNLLERLDDVPAFLAALRRYGLPVLVSYRPADGVRDGNNGDGEDRGRLTRARLVEALGAAGFGIAAGESVGRHGLLLLLRPGVPPVLPRRRVLVLCPESADTFGGSLRRQLLAELLPAAAQVHWSTLDAAWQPPPGPWDLALLGTGGTMSAGHLSDALLAFASTAPTLGLFGTAWREAIPRDRLTALLQRLGAWFAASREDLDVFGRGVPRCVHFGNWLFNAFPLSLGQAADRLALDDPTRGEFAVGSFSDPVARIQRQRQLSTGDVDIFTCALTSASEVGYCEVRDPDTWQPSGRFRSVLMDVFGECPPEGRLFSPHRDAVVAYKERMQARARDLAGVLQKALA